MPRRIRGEAGQAAVEYVGLLALVVVVFGLAVYRVQLADAGRVIAATVSSAYPGQDEDANLRRARSELDASIAGAGLSLPLAIERATTKLGSKGVGLARLELLAKMPDGARALLGAGHDGVDPATGGTLSAIPERFGFHVVTSDDEAKSRGLYQPDLHLDDVGRFIADAGLEAVAGKASEAAAEALAKTLARARGAGSAGSGEAARFGKAAIGGVGEGAAAMAGTHLEPGADAEGDVAAGALAAFASASNEDLPPIGAQAGDVILCSEVRVLHVALDRTSYGPARSVAVGFRPGVDAYTTGRLSDPALCRPS